MTIECSWCYLNNGFSLLEIDIYCNHDTKFPMSLWFYKMSKSFPIYRDREPISFECVLPHSRFFSKMFSWAGLGRVWDYLLVAYLYQNTTACARDQRLTFPPEVGFQFLIYLLSSNCLTSGAEVRTLPLRLSQRNTKTLLVAKWPQWSYMLIFQCKWTDM